MTTLGQHVALGIVRGLVLCLVLSVSALVGMQVDRGEQASVSPPTRALSTEYRRILDRHRCSTEGFGPGEPVAGAVVRRGGSVVHVTFEEGWEAYTSGGRGTLLAVCREAPRR
jgi:hypothetical protein